MLFEFGEDVFELEDVVVALQSPLQPLQSDPGEDVSELEDVVIVL